MNITLKSLFFKNLSIRQTIAKNTFWLAVSEVITGLLKFALLVLAVRTLGALEYGKFTFAFSFVSIMVIFADLGIIETATKEFTQSQHKKNFPEFFTLNVILTIIVFVVMFVGSFLVTSDPIIRKTTWILSLFILTTSFCGIFYAFLRSMQRMEYEGLVKIIHSVLIFLVTIFVLLYFKSALGFAYGYLLSNVIFLALFLLFFHFHFQPLMLKWNKHIFTLLKMSWPLTLGFTSGWICMATTSVVLGYFNLITENGWYGAAYKMAFMALVPATLIVRSFYPVLGKLFIVSIERFQKTWDYLMMSMIFLAVPIALGGVMLSPQIISFFYGNEFLPAVFILQALILVIAINLINYPFSLALVVSNEQKKNFFIIFSGAAVNIALSIVFITLYGLLGAVIAVTLSSLLVLFLTIIILKYFTNLRVTIFNAALFKYTMMACFSGLIMFLSSVCRWYTGPIFSIRFLSGR